MLALQQDVLESGGDTSIDAYRDQFASNTEENRRHKAQFASNTEGNRGRGQRR